MEASKLVTRSEISYEDDDDGYDGENSLQKRFESLEKRWDSIKNSNPRTSRRYSAGDDSTPTVSGDHLLFQLLDNSPKELMSSLQQQKESPVEAEDKGLGFSEESEMGSISDETDDICSECLDLFQESEVKSTCSYVDGRNFHRFPADSPPPSDGEGREETGARVVAARDDGRRGGGGRDGGRWMVNVVWVGGVLMLFTLGFVTMKCNGGDEATFVPT